MPLYDFKCESEDCGKIFEALSKWEDKDFKRCSSCDSPTQCLLSAPRHIPFHEGWYEHLGPEPVYVTSKRQLKDICEKNGKGSVYLDDS